MGQSRQVITRLALIRRRVSIEEHVRAREYLFMEGDPAHWLCVVESGHVKIQ